jgi:hypothetical protein
MHHPTADHASHDSALITALAAGDLVDSARTRAQALVDSCTSCAALERDLIAIAHATRTLPTRAISPRDHRLTAEHAARLRRTGRWRAILGPFAGTRTATRSLAAACTSLGLIGLLVVTVMPGLGGGATMLTPRDQTGTEAAPAPGTAAPALGPGSLQGGRPDPNATDGVALGANDHKSSTAPEVGAAGAPAPTQGDGSPAGTVDEPTPPNLLLVGSLGLLSAGLLLFALRIAARRLRT